MSEGMLMLTELLMWEERKAARGLVSMMSRSEEERGRSVISAKAVRGSGGNIVPLDDDCEGDSSKEECIGDFVFGSKSPTGL
jgi:hypothetical protein